MASLSTSEQSASRRAVVFTALPIEYAAARSFLSDINRVAELPGIVSERGRFSSSTGRPWDVVIIRYGGLGRTNEALEISRAILKFDPSVVLFIGIAAGLRDVSLGDVVVGNEVEVFSQGKVQREALPRYELRSSYRMQQYAHAEARSHEWLNRTSTPQALPAPRVHIGAIAAATSGVSNDFPMTSSPTFLREMKAVEMEGSNLVETLHRPQLDVLIVRGISDFADRRTGGRGFQEIAAQNASALAFEILSKIDTQPQVFFAYATADRAFVHHVADLFRQANMTVWLANAEIGPGESLKVKIDDWLRTSDYVVVFLSPHSAKSGWVETEIQTTLTRDLRTRAVTVVPVLLEDCEIPAFLRDRVFFDLREHVNDRIQELVRRLSTIPEIDFSNWTPQRFEELVKDLLVSLGCSLEPRAAGRGPDQEFDLIIDNPQGSQFEYVTRGRWLVEAKLYGYGRVAVPTVLKLVRALKGTSGSLGALVVTNAQLTTATRKAVEDARQDGADIRVLEGSDLRQLILANTQIAKQFFHQTNE